MQDYANIEQADEVWRGAGRLKDRQLLVSFTENKQEPGGAAGGQMHVKAVYVGNLPAGTTEEKLKETFSAHGTVRCPSFLPLPSAPLFHLYEG